VSKYVKVALFFILIGGAGMGYIIMSSSGMSSFNTRTYEVIVPDASGLSTRSQVYLAGVSVGQVEKIELEGQSARLRVGILKNVDVREGASISRKSSSILGTAVLALDPGPEGAPLLPPGGRIQTDLTSGSLEEVMGTVNVLGGQLTGILDEFQKNQMALLTVTLETLNSIAGKVDARTDEELDRVSRILESVALITERTERILANGEGDIRGSVQDIHGALSNIREITEEIRSGEGNIGKTIYDDQLYLGILRTVNKTDETVERLNETLGSVDHLVKNVDGVVDDAGEVVKKAMGLGISVDAGARYDFRAQAVRSQASLRIDPASNDRWYRIGVSSLPKGPGDTKTPLGFDAEIARKIGMFTLRGGLYESNVGFGLDIQPIRWVSLSTEFFNFDSGGSPNLRTFLTYYPFFDPDSDKPWNWLYLKAGVNDLLSNDRDFFLGGGIRFADREVKGLVGFLPLFN